MNCPQCGMECKELVEGYCQDCTDENYNNLFKHQSELEHWESLTAKEKERKIKGTRDE
jgi:hypothetical protein